MIRKLIDNYKKEMELRRQEDELYSLDDRTLADIGINRGMIPFIVRTDKA